MHLVHILVNEWVWLKLRVYEGSLCAPMEPYLEWLWLQFAIAHARYVRFTVNSGMCVQLWRQFFITEVGKL